jgi:hypothetical protein
MRSNAHGRIVSAVYRIRPRTRGGCANKKSELQLRPMPPETAPPPLPWDQEEPVPAPRRRWLVILGLVVGIPVGCIAVLGVLGWLFLATAKDVPVLPKDQAVLIQVDELRPWLDDFKPLKAAESVTKVRYFDASYELEYIYDHPAGTLYLANTVDVERDASEAFGTYQAAKIGTRIGISLAAETNMTHADRNDLFRWGDDSTLTVISSDGRPIGNMFCARKGKRVFTFLIVGLYFDDADDLKKLLGPKLERLEAYEP